jgi:galactosyl transferase GMA12/MNN10 family
MIHSFLVDTRSVDWFSCFSWWLLMKKYPPFSGISSNSSSSCKRRHHGGLVSCLINKLRLVWQRISKQDRFSFFVVRPTRSLLWWGIGSTVVLVVFGYQAWSSYANAQEDLTKTLHYQNTRSYGACPMPNYTMNNATTVVAMMKPQQQQAPVAPHSICLTTLTDEAVGGWYQKLFRWRNYNNLLDITWGNKQQYVAFHGYRLFNESTTSLDTTRPPSWSKIKAVKRLLLEENCQWVFWMVRTYGRLSCCCLLFVVVAMSGSNHQQLC